jgi:hypothetical protein
MVRKRVELILGQARMYNLFAYEQNESLTI